MQQILDQGTTELVHPTNGVVGYVFAENDATNTDQQTQRWVLYSNYVDPPTGVVTLRLPTETSRRYTSFEDWVSALRDGDLWQSGAEYVKVTCTMYDHIPSAPAPSPEQQLDYGPSQLEVGTTIVGYAFGVREDNHSEEHWVLKGSYAPPHTAAVKISGASTSSSSPTVGDFLEDMDTNWTTGSTYVYCECITYTSLPSEL